MKFLLRLPSIQNHPMIFSPPKTRILLLLVICLLLSSCYQAVIKSPPPKRLFGTYKPVTYLDKRVQSTSQIKLLDDHKCVLTDFPVVTYISNQEPSLHTYTGEGTWSLDNTTGTWKLVIKIDKTEFQLRISTYNPLTSLDENYLLSQEGEAVEDDALTFEQSKN